MSPRPIDGPLDVVNESVPSVGAPGDLTLVDGRTFAISDMTGNMIGGTHGLVHDDRRHISRLHLGIPGTELQTLASTSPTPLTSVTVARALDAEGIPASCLVIRRRWLAGGMREDIELRETGPLDRSVDLVVNVAADFAHVFDVKGGRGGTAARIHELDGGWHLVPEDPAVWSTRVTWDREPDTSDPESGTLTWRMAIAARGTVVLQLIVEPVVTDDPVDISLLRTKSRITPIPLHEVKGWRERVPVVVSSDPRVAPAFDRAVADLAALRITDRGHPDRVLTAAGAPWYMTLFGRDSLLTALMTLGFDPDLATGVLLSLADLQGRTDDPVSDEQPGKILHELRRHGSGGPFADRSRYYGTVDATPLFVWLTAEARRWGAIDTATLELLAPAVHAAVGWILRGLDRNPVGCLGYERKAAEGLSNQGWKDSWNGVTFADGTMPSPPVALAEVQGYAYAGLLGAAALAAEVDIGHRPADLRARADTLQNLFNELFWDDRGWFVLGLDGSRRPIDSLTTNPGHAVWCGIADDALANEYLGRLLEPALFTGWGLRTLSTAMTAYDPLSYHNGSVWPHDTAICAAGAARVGRWDVVDSVVDGLLDVATHFHGRPPELFAGFGRGDVPTPVAYPAACSPQAWSSASLLLLVRTIVGLEPKAGAAGVELRRPALGEIPDVEINGLYAPGGRTNIRVAAGRARITRV